MVFVVEAGGDRVVGIVHFGDDVRNRKLQAVCDMASLVGLWDQAEFWGQVH